MNPKWPTFRGTARQLLGVYEKILGRRYFIQALASTNATGRRLKFLASASRGQVERDLMTVEEAIEFFESLVECCALGLVTGDERSVFDPPSVDDPTLLARASDRRAALRQVDDDAVSDWYFQMMVRAWLKKRGFGNLRDLRDAHEFKGKRVCEFAPSKSDGQHELVECKRLHPQQPGGEVQIEVIRRKICAKAREDAGPQLCSAARVLRGLGKEVVCKHLMVEVSAYHPIPTQQRIEDECAEKVFGLSNSEIQCILDGIEQLAADGIDKVTVCWRNVVYFDGLPRAIVQNALAACTNREGQGLFEYDGWTVEGFPLLHSRYREFRVSTVARSMDWIRYGYVQSLNPSSTFTLGPEQRAT